MSQNKNLDFARKVFLKLKENSFQAHEIEDAIETIHHKMNQAQVTDFALLDASGELGFEGVVSVLSKSKEVLEKRHTLEALDHRISLMRHNGQESANLDHEAFLHKHLQFSSIFEKLGVDFTPFEQGKTLTLQYLEELREPLAVDVQNNPLGVGVAAKSGQPIGR